MDREFRFLRPFYRMLEKCIELSRLSSERADEMMPKLSDGTSINLAEEDEHA